VLNIALIDSDPLIKTIFNELKVEIPFSILFYDNVKEFINDSTSKNIDYLPDYLFIAEDIIDVISELEEVLKLAKNTNYKFPPKIVVTSTYGKVASAVKFFKMGVNDYVVKPLSKDNILEIFSNYNLENSKKLNSKAASSFKSKVLKDFHRPIITVNSLMKRILAVAEVVAQSEATVLVQGESGTGKELLARFIHETSPRRAHPFVAVNCAALPENLLESELFGHEKGAFTGAVARKIGKFEQAEGGTILLDEISEMNLLLQAKLLRVLQEREVSRLGGFEPVAIDVRIIATTNRKLLNMVKSGDFREDLFYRLNVVPLTLPPLRERKDDIKILFNFFAKKYLGKNIYIDDSKIIEYLTKYDWPGNIRELQNCVERASILSLGRGFSSEDFLIGDEDFILALDNKNIDSATTKDSLSLKIQKDSYSSINYTDAYKLNDSLVIKSGMKVSEAEKFLIEETLKKNNNNRTKAAELLGISVRTLRNKLGEYQIIKK
jgi:DNA-binding NtrC family response regulator